jgi:FkbM family methyltransferase
MYRTVAEICRECARSPGYRNYLRFKLLRSIGCDIAPSKAAKRVPVNPTLPREIAESIAQSAVRLRSTPDHHLENPFPILGFTAKFLDEQLFRHVFREVFVQGCYLFSGKTPEPVVVDCGSNIGLSILFFKALYPRARVIGFEPDPCTFAVVSENVNVNKLCDVELHNIALASDDGPIEFYVSPEQAGSLMMSAHRERQPGAAITVPGRRLSSFVPECVDLLKMDIEGSEDVVMRELETSGMLSRIDQIHLEYHHHITPECNSMSEILALLERNGFGYQVQSAPPSWPTPTIFQDISIFAYRQRIFTC